MGVYIYILYIYIYIYSLKIQPNLKLYAWSIYLILPWYVFVLM